MGLEVDAEDQLFLLETVIESVTLRVDRDDNDDECNDSPEDPPWTICFRLCNTFSFEMKQEDEEKTEENICPRTKECTVKFHAGKSCMFSANPLKFLQVIQDNPIYVTIGAQYLDSVAPDILGQGEIEFDDTMIAELCTCLKEDSSNSETSCKGCYPLCDSKQQQVGVIKLYLRLSFYGKCILSEFKLMSGMDNILFKVQNEDERNKCFKCGKAKVKAAPSEDLETDSANKAFADDDLDWGNTYDRQTSFHPRNSVSYGDNNLFKYGKGNFDPCYTPTITKNYETFKRSDDLQRSVDIFKNDIPRQSCSQPYGEQHTSIYRRSELPASIIADADQRFSLKYKASSESIDFRKIIGEEKMNYPPSEDARSYITPMLYYDEKEYARDELKVRKAPTLKAGPKRRKKLKAKKTGNFEPPGVKVGHKECVKQTKNVPKRSGWLWPEKTKKTPGWKPGSVPRNIAEILDSSRVDADGGKGDFPRRSSSKKHEMKTVEKTTEKTEEKTEERTGATQEVGSLSRIHPVADGDEQPSLHFKMCGGSYMISVNPAALGDKSKDKRNQNGLFMRLNKKEEDIDSTSSDLEIAFTTPRLKKDPLVSVETRENVTQYFLEDIPQVPNTPLLTPRGRQRIGRDDEWEEGISASVIGGKGKVNGKKNLKNQSKTDEKAFQNYATEQDARKGNTKNDKAPSEGDSPKIIVWDRDQETAVGQLRGKTAKK